MMVRARLSATRRVVAGLTLVAARDAGPALASHGSIDVESEPSWPFPERGTRSAKAAAAGLA